MKLPPYADTLGIALASAPGEPPLLTMAFGGAVIGRPGFLHGGAIAGLLEMAAIAALSHALGDEGDRIKPINVTIDYMRGGRERETWAQGIVTRLGTRIANVEAMAWQEDRTRPIAAARMHYMLTRVSASAA
ncbi:PaaI family thioesterase [Sphingomonas baiyangensis]|uniref:PaaI family thioesterase n=1 Tax=Sphingomonas baiyangensis TaxID=2572576 RepID=A0A4U1L552_9SPHN|nr:PaaI family thioesterase [Sphingomonas baiyangensis]TKD52029.1 PaaI family thioesterase [Sphingomonas baiyangensis]